MTFTDAKKNAREGRKIRRENWYESFYILADTPVPDRKLSWIDSSGRTYEISHNDENATNWEIAE